MCVSHLALPRAHHDIHTVHFMLLELEIIHPRVCVPDTEHHFVGVDYKLLHLVGEHAFCQLAVVHFCHLVESLCHVLALTAERKKGRV